MGNETKAPMYKVQDGYCKGAYRTRWEFDNEQQAIRWYNGINTHSGFKKRLVAPDGKVLARVIT
jgi:hypothetical protein